MADQTVSVRITADGSGLTKTASESATALQRLEGEAARLGQFFQGLGQSASAAGAKIAGAFQGIRLPAETLTGSMAKATVAGELFMQVLDGLTRSLGAPVAELMEAEQTAARLTGVFQGNAKAIQEVTAAASALAGQSVFFDDDAIAGAAGILGTFGANKEAIEALLPVIHDLAVASGTDVADAAQKLGMAFQGQTRALGTMIPEVKGAKSQLEVLAAVQSASARLSLTQKSLTEGVTGAFAGLKKSAAEAAQSIGNTLQPAILAILGWLTKLVELGPKIVPAFAGAAGTIGAFLGGVIGGGSLSAGVEEAKRFRAQLERVTEEARKASEAVGKVTTGFDASKVAGGLTGIRWAGGSGSQPTKPAGSAAPTGTLSETMAGLGPFNPMALGALVSAASNLRKEIADFAEISAAVAEDNAVIDARTEETRRNLEGSVEALSAAADIRDRDTEAMKAQGEILRGLLGDMLEAASGLVRSLVSGNGPRGSEIARGIGNIGSGILSALAVGATGTVAGAPAGVVFAGAAAGVKLLGEGVGAALGNFEQAGDTLSRGSSEASDYIIRKAKAQAEYEISNLYAQKTQWNNFWGTITGKAAKDEAARFEEIKKQLVKEANEKARANAERLRQEQANAEEVKRAWIEAANKAALFQRGNLSEGIRLGIEERLKAGGITDQQAEFERARLSAAERASAEAGGVATKLGQDIFGAILRASPEQAKAIAEAARKTAPGDLVGSQLAELIRQATGFTSDSASSIEYIANLFRGLALTLAEPAATPEGPTTGGGSPETEVPGASPDRPVYSYLTNPEDISRYAFMPRSFSFRPARSSSRAIEVPRAV